MPVPFAERLKAEAVKKLKTRPLRQAASMRAKVPPWSRSIVL